jgi:catechol 2,3-dioxygenase-like lactoylglutathione lyase family enzyme
LRERSHELIHQKAGAHGKTKVDVAGKSVCEDQFREVILMTRRWRNVEFDRGERKRKAMSNQWYSRPVLFVADIERSIDFYVKQLGFTQLWRYEEEGKAWVAQVDRQGCELILSSQWPDKVGKGLMFISLDAGVLDALRAELEGRGVDVKDGQWGYRLMVIKDPDGNELYFPYPTSLATGSHATSLPGH